MSLDLGKTNYSHFSLLNHSMLTIIAFSYVPISIYESAYSS